MCDNNVCRSMGFAHPFMLIEYITSGCIDIVDERV